MLEQGFNNVVNIAKDAINKNHIRWLILNIHISNPESTNRNN